MELSLMPRELRVLFALVNEAVESSAYEDHEDFDALLDVRDRLFVGLKEG